MGLDTTHDCWHGPYSSFTDWRTELAKVAGWEIKVDERGRDRYVIPGDHIHPRTYQGWWDETPEDPLDVLLIHSDCDGYIFPRDAVPLAKRLDELAPQIEDEQWRERTYEFARGLRRAADPEGYWWQIVEFR